ncbi:hypothetical protein PNOK_0973500 [Pyrrhoderma noxium]|uniref:Uncharacterized protein n=1 Tax=Pyrrhoderma noxium TaxID=2282107 RepID=A0A286U501_9AGAM|nr:hypothetical protein PNOK_0973500 [Pyrrhoderma noxium]
MDDSINERVHSHKAMAYTRAPPSFQARYFSFRSPPIASPLPFGTSPTPYPSMPATSVLSLNPDVYFYYNASVRSVSPSNFRPTSPAPSVIDVPTIGNSTTTEEETAPGFYSYRFILATRAPYFYDQLITYGLKNLPPPGEPAKL